MPREKALNGWRYCINIAHDATSPFIQANNPTNQFYTQATFPVSATDIYSYPAGASFGNGFTFAPNSLGGFTNAAINVSLPAFPVNTEASVLGVNGNYNYKANNAEWHTNLVPGGTTNHPGVIEIGTKTRGSGSAGRAAGLPTTRRSFWRFANAVLRPARRTNC